MNNPAVNQPENLNVTAKISVNFSASDKQRVVDAATAVGKKFSDFVRDTLLREVTRIEKRR